MQDFTGWKTQLPPNITSPQLFICFDQKVDLGLKHVFQVHWTFLLQKKKKKVHGTIYIYIYIYIEDLVQVISDVILNNITPLNIF